MAGERSGYFNLDVDLEDAFGTLNGSPDWDPVYVRGDFFPSLTQDALEDETAKQGPGVNPPVPGTKANSSMTIPCYPTGLGTAADNGTAATEDGFGKLLESFTGSAVLDTGSDIKTGDASQPVVNGTGDISDDSLVAIVTPNNGTLVRHVESISTSTDDTLNLSYDLPEAPDASAEVYAFANYPLQSAFGSSVQFRHLTERADQNATILGCRPNSFSITVGNVAELWQAEFGFDVTDWDKTVGSSSLTKRTPPSKRPWMDSQVDLWPYSASPGVAYSANYRRCFRSLTITGTRENSKEHCAYETQGVGDIYAADTMIEIEATVPVDDAWEDAFVAGTEYGAIFTSGRTPGDIFAMYARKLVLLEQPVVQDLNGIMVVALRLGLVADAGSPGIVFGRG